ncbi:hypothetical protein [Streptomyces aidingensis]|uniref:Uncharacterized protein n=1 Tax=Streptomyces aidingensis TaxID=910347 RepID=A0A1I1UTB0_9ACTN|nr:hypothetical protein [Streptomyces aidingensis]SFD74051.1 hypothetical protein SAMN05421773_1276 [Streptomyces aidingensis]
MTSRRHRTAALAATALAVLALVPATGCSQPPAADHPDLSAAATTTTDSSGEAKEPGPQRENEHQEQQPDPWPTPPPDEDLTPPSPAATEPDQAPGPAAQEAGPADRGRRAEDGAQRRNSGYPGTSHPEPRNQQLHTTPEMPREGTGRPAPQSHADQRNEQPDPAGDLPHAPNIDPGFVCDIAHDQVDPAIASWCPAVIP